METNKAILTAGYKATHIFGIAVRHRNSPRLVRVVGLLALSCQTTLEVAKNEVSKTTGY